MQSGTKNQLGGLKFNTFFPHRISLSQGFRSRISIILSCKYLSYRPCYPPKATRMALESMTWNAFINIS